MTWKQAVRYYEELLAKKQAELRVLEMTLEDARDQAKREEQDATPPGGGLG